MRAKKAAAAVEVMPGHLLDIGQLKAARVMPRVAPAISTVLTVNEMYDLLSDREQRSVDDLIRLLWQRHQ